MNTSLLIVEDDPVLSQALRMKLEQGTIDFAIEATLAGAKRYLETHAPSLIVLDLILPDGHGRDLFAYLHTHQMEIPVIVATNVSNSDIRKECMELGALDVIIKGNVSLAHMIECMTKHANRSVDG